MPHPESAESNVDYDGDGWIDLFVVNHRKAGSIMEPLPHIHTTSSMLYWGGPNGYSDDNRSLIQGIGPSGLNLRDAGNSYDRGLYEDYFSIIFCFECYSVIFIFFGGLVKVSRDEFTRIINDICYLS